MSEERHILPYVRRIHIDGLFGYISVDWQLRRGVNVLSGINQVHVNEMVGLTFSAALRAILRQAPNIIMVGEIRDLETASIAINASLTGHLVFSTLHTNDAPSAVTRLIDIGVKPFLIATSARAFMAQRLVRKICKKCGQPVPLTEAEMRPLGIQSENVVVDFKEGDTVTVISGVWADTVGVIQSMNQGKQSVIINVDLFGRETPVEIGFSEIRKM